MPTVLTTLQYEIARLEAAGLPRDEICRRTGSPRHSVVALLCRIRQRLGVTTRRGLAVALQDCEARPWDGGGHFSPSGLRRGDRVRITGGRFAGRTGIYVGANNGTQRRIQVGGGVFAITARFIERTEDTESV